MGSSQSSNKMHCNRYLSGQEPQSKLQQVHDDLNRGITQSHSYQPQGQMIYEIIHKNMAGFTDTNTLKITFTFPEGIQKDKHPHPGQPYVGIRLYTYLPDNRQGKDVLKLLEKAFNQQCLFTIATNGSGQDVITPASVPLKTHVEEEGIMSDGNSDTNYMKTLSDVLKKNLKC